MYSLSEEQIEFVYSDIRRRGVYHPSLCDDLLDHICCMLEERLEAGGDFVPTYLSILESFGEQGLRGIQDETTFLLTHKYYRPMKKIAFISGIVASISIVAGAYFKMHHWMGAGVLLVSGTVLFALIFLPLLFLVRFKEASDRKDKIVTITGLLTALFVAATTLMRVMHWPYSGHLLIMSFSVFFLVFLPLYFTNGYRNPLTRFTTIGNTVMMASLGGLMLLLSSNRQSMAMTHALHNAAMHDHALVEKTSKQNHAAITKLNPAAENKEQIAQLESALSNFESVMEKYRQQAIASSNDSQDPEAINFYAFFYPEQQAMKGAELTEATRKLHDALKAISGESYTEPAAPDAQMLGALLITLDEQQLAAEQQVNSVCQYLLGKSGK